MSEWIPIVEAADLGNDASTAQTRVAGILESCHWYVVWEYEVHDRGDGRTGRIDLIAFRDGNCICIEVDREVPRKKSIRKLRETGYPGYVVLRDPRHGWSRVNPVCPDACQD